MGPNSSIRLKLDEWMESKNHNFSSIMEAWGTSEILDMVRDKIGIGYFIKEMIDNQIDSDNFECIKLNEELPSVDLCLLYIEDFLTTATKKFINEMKSKYNK